MHSGAGANPYVQRLRDDPQFALELGYCVDKAIPHSKFLEEWGVEDRAKLVAYKIEESTRCQMCGTAEWEWDANPYAYEPVQKRCHGCYLKDISHEDGQTTPGTQVILLPSKTVTDEMRQGLVRSRERRGFA